MVLHTQIYTVIIINIMLQKHTTDIQILYTWNSSDLAKKFRIVVASANADLHK
jgi:hypothetical protein